jgi:hypothetical protein
VDWAKWEGLPEWRADRGAREDVCPTQAFRRAVRMCERWGVRLVLGPLEGPAVARALGRRDWLRGRDCSCAPQNIAWLFWKRALIVWNDEMEDLEAGNLLHELAHAVLSEDPRLTNEVYGPLLYVEYALERACGVPRTKLMEGYCIEDVRKWRELSTAERGRYLRESFEEACKVGLVTRDGKLSYRKLSPGSPQSGSPLTSR